jgi:mannose-6-phosphate isomerase-like protein (cupin superfamily)
MQTTRTRPSSGKRSTRKAARPAAKAAARVQVKAAPKAAAKPAPKAAASRPAPAPRPAAGQRRYTQTSLGSLSQVKGWNALNTRLELKGMGITVAEYPAGKGYEHTHYHSEQEEVYLLASGRGQMVVDDEVIDLREGDIVRVGPPARRALRSHPSSPSVWVMIGATPGLYKENDYTELENEPARFDI